MCGRGKLSQGASARMSVYTLVRRVVSACEWGGMLVGTLVYRHGPKSGELEHGSKTGGPITQLGSCAPLALFCCCVLCRCQAKTCVPVVSLRLASRPLMLQVPTRRLAPAGERKTQARKVTSPDLPKHEMGPWLVTCKERGKRQAFTATRITRAWYSTPHAASFSGKCAPTPRYDNRSDKGGNHRKEGSGSPLRSIL